MERQAKGEAAPAGDMSMAKIFMALHGFDPGQAQEGDEEAAERVLEIYSGWLKRSSGFAKALDALERLDGGAMAEREALVRIAAAGASEESRAVEGIMEQIGRASLGIRPLFVKMFGEEAQTSGNACAKALCSRLESMELSQSAAAAAPGNERKPGM